MGNIFSENQENVDALTSLCAANLTRLGRLFVRGGRFGDAREVLALAARLGSLEALAEMDNYYAHGRNQKHFRLAG